MSGLSPKQSAQAILNRAQNSPLKQCRRIPKRHWNALRRIHALQDERAQWEQIPRQLNSSLGRERNPQMTMAGPPNTMPHKVPMNDRMRLTFDVAYRST
jgi:hypothetical protein